MEADGEDDTEEGLMPYKPEEKRRAVLLPVEDGSSKWSLYA